MTASVPLVDLRCSTRRSPTRSRPASPRSWRAGDFIGGKAVDGVRAASTPTSSGLRPTASASPTAPTPSRSRCGRVGVGPGDEVVAAGQHVHRHRRGGGAGRRRVRCSSTSTPTHLLHRPGGVAAAVTDRGPQAIMPGRTSTGRSPRSSSSAALAEPRRRRRRGRARSPRARRGTGPRRQASARSRRPASTRARTSAPTATPARCSPTTRSSPAGCGCSAQPRQRRRSTCHDVVGFNSRLDTLQAVVLRAKLRRLAGWNDARRAAAERYDELLAGVDGRAPCRVAARGQRARLAPLRRAGRPTGTGCCDRAPRRGHRRADPLPGPGAPDPAFSHLDHGRGAFPVAEAAARPDPVAAHAPRPHRSTNRCGICPNAEGSDMTSLGVAQQAPPSSPPGLAPERLQRLVHRRSPTAVSTCAGAPC